VSSPKTAKSYKHDEKSALISKWYSFINFLYLSSIFIFLIFQIKTMHSFHII
jgi:hypothetical protein